MESNGIFLLIVVLFIMLMKMVRWTIRVHQFNIKIQEKLGKDVYEWMITDGQPLPKPLPKLEINDEAVEKLSELIKVDYNSLSSKFNNLGIAFKNLGTALTIIKVKNEF